MSVGVAVHSHRDLTPAEVSGYYATRLATARLETHGDLSLLPPDGRFSYVKLRFLDKQNGKTFRQWQ